MARLSQNLHVKNLMFLALNLFFMGVKSKLIIECDEIYDPLASNGRSFNVQSYGAVGNGAHDDTEVFVCAWNDACKAPGATLHVPRGKTFLVNNLNFQGVCQPGFIFQAIQFNDVKRSSFVGMTVMNSSQLNVILTACDTFQIVGITNRVPRNSPNTDGIDTSQSTKIVIKDSNIGTGDDCIAIGDGSSNFRISGITCGPGHGITIGSLGKETEEQMSIRFM